jgi:hypothetical protein
MYHHYLLFVICSFVFCVVLTFTRFVKAYGHRWYDVCGTYGSKLVSPKTIPSTSVCGGGTKYGL